VIVALVNVVSLVQLFLEHLPWFQSQNFRDRFISISVSSQQIVHRLFDFGI